MRLCLSDEGYDVDVRQTGRDGMDVALEGTYDVVLLDMQRSGQLTIVVLQARIR